MSDEGAGRRAAASIVSGLIFGAAWWLLIDGYSSCQYQPGADCSNASGSAGYAWLPPFGATLAFVMINGMKWSDLRADETKDDVRGAARARIFLLFALLISVFSIGGGAFVMAEKFLRVAGQYNWAGVSCFVSTLMITIATFMLRFLSLPPSDAYV